jgi:glycosyltransferase involved in cell wall biosynthesis
MRFSILSVAFPFAPVRSDCAGGAEQILLTIDEFLFKYGHLSTVLATNNSKVSGTLISVPEITDIITECEKEKIYKKVKNSLQMFIQCNKVDCIHFHGIDFYNYLPDTEMPCLVTLHLPIQWYPLHCLESVQNSIFYNFVSESQRCSAPSSIKCYPVIENGVRIFENNTKILKCNYLLCIGRICPEKGFDIGLRVAKKSKIPLFIAGQVFPYESHIEYFNKEIFPELDNENYRFIGKLEPNIKMEMIARARCVLVPSRVDETSSLVAMEALSCGTPVVAFNRGALSSIIEHGKTGFICNTEDEMIEAIDKISIIDPDVCIQTAKERFSCEKMIRKYFQFYENIKNKESRKTAQTEKLW